MPERFVGVDVPEPGNCALIEDRRLDRCSSIRQPAAEKRLGESALERFRPEPDVEVPLCVLALEQLPRAESP